MSISDATSASVTPSRSIPGISEATLDDMAQAAEISAISASSLTAIVSDMAAEASDTAASVTPFSHSTDP